jgi:hypothetical protein
MRNSSRFIRFLIPAGLIWVVLNGIGVISFSPCLFHLITGLPCPSCGTTRAILALFEGNWAGSLRINPLGLLSVGLFTSGALIILLERTIRKPLLKHVVNRCVFLLQQKHVAAPLVLLLLVNWFWNISKGL